jgi:aspartate/methionine/tyrosine aminotransferase
MIIRRFFMEDWLASHKDTCVYNLGESGMPDCTVGEILERCGLSPDSIASLCLKDNDTRGSERLRLAILKTYTPPVRFENITVTTGTSEALFILFNILMEKRSSIVVPWPSFQALYEVPRALGAELRFYRLNDDNEFLPDPDEICGMIDDTTGVVVINTPHNPSGRLFPEEAVEPVIRKAAFHGAAVISDEHYRFLPLNGVCPLKTFARPGENVIATGSITKCFGVIGLRIGWIAAPEILISGVRDFRDYLTHTLSPVSDFLAAVVLEHAEAIINPNREKLKKNFISLGNMVEDTRGISLVSPEAGIVAFPAFNYKISSDEFARGLIEKHGVFVLPGSSFETENHFRINLGQEPDLFLRALHLIGEYCAGLADG